MASSPSRRIAVRLPRRNALLPFALVLLSSCSCCNNKLTEVQVRPDAVQIRVSVVPGASMADVPPFLLQARLSDKCNGVLPDVERDEQGHQLTASSQHQLVWSWEPTSSAGWFPPGGLTPDGRYVNVDIGSVPASQLPLKLELRVEVAGTNLSGSATVELYERPPAGEIEVPETTTSAALPVIAVVEYGSPPAAYAARALVEAGYVSPSVAAGAAAEGAAILRMRKSADVRAQPAVPTTGLPAVPRTLDAKFWLAVPNDPGLSDLVKLEARLADTVFARNRVGVRIGDIHPVFIQATDVRTGQSGAACARGVGSGPPFFNALSGGAGPDFTNTSVLNVVYVSSIDGGRAFACDHRPGLVGALIVIAESERQPTDLAHEVGHALSLGPGNVHVSDWPSFEALHRVNLMTNVTDKKRLRSLDHLTVGQAYWMNLSDDSWINLQLTPPFTVYDCAGGECAPVETGKDHLQ